MEDVRQAFLAEAISKLEQLQTRLAGETFSQNLEQEIFRRLHTVKGNSQTFNLNVSAKLAHELETLLQAARDNHISTDQDFLSLISQGINLLHKTLRNVQLETEVKFPADYVEKIHQLIPSSKDSAAPFVNLNDVIEPNLLSQLSEQEKESVATAVSRGNFLYRIEVGFELAIFGEQFKNLRERLTEQGEIIANFPSPKFTTHGKIGFQILLASLKDADSIRKTVEPFNAELLSHSDKNSFSHDLRGILGQAISSGKQTAQTFSKQIEFETICGEVRLSVEQLKLVSEILLHLVRNAIDHAIENDGKISVEVLSRENEVILRVSDDGRGIDDEKIRAKAVAKNLIAADENLSVEDLRKLLFTSGFSTREQVSEISGRGVGLDVVAEAVKNLNGVIRIESENGKGTTFEVTIPQDK